MTIDRETAGILPVTEQTLPTESKYALDLKKDEARLHRIEAKELREFNRPMVEYDSNKKLAEAMWNPRDIIKDKLVKQEFESISEDDALHIPER